MNPRDQFIVSKIENFRKFLAPFTKKEWITYPDLRRELRNVLRGGSYAAMLKDAKLLGLIENGTPKGAHLTADGQRFLDKPDPSFLQMLGLKVPVFNHMFYNGIKDKHKVKEYIRSQIGKHYSDSTLNVWSHLAMLRYYDFVWADGLVGFGPQEAIAPELNTVITDANIKAFADAFKNIPDPAMLLTASQFYDLRQKIRALWNEFPKKLVDEVYEKESKS